MDVRLLGMLDTRAPVALTGEIEAGGLVESTLSRPAERQESAAHATAEADLPPLYPFEVDPDRRGGGEYVDPDHDMMSRPTDVEGLRPSGTQPISSSDTEPPSRPHTRAPGIVERQGGRLRRRLTVYLSPELAKRLAIHCASSDLEMSEVVEKALAKHLGG